MMRVESKSVPHALASFEAVLCDANHAIAVAVPLLVQVRRGPMTIRDLDEIERRVREVRARLSAGQRIGLVAVLEEGVPVASEEVRLRQRRLISAMIDGLDARIAAIVVGAGIGPMLHRTIARGVLFANPRVKIGHTAEEAAAWVAPHLGASPADVTAVVQRTRALR